MGVSFTPDQQKVIDLRNRNILVSAAAGSGKTAVLVERIIRMICDEENPVDIDRLLIVTFTNAAAAEMRERISQGIAGEIAMHPDSEHLERQATLLHNALITTIDSFCLYLLRNHFHEIGLDPAFRVADMGEIKLLREEVMKELLEESFASKDENFEKCVEYFCPAGRESVLEGYILGLCDYAESYPWPQEWLSERKKDYLLDSVEELEESAFGKYLLKHLQKITAGCMQTMEQMQKLCEEPDGPHMYGELADKELEQLKRLSSCKKLEDWEQKLSGFQFDRLSSAKDPSVDPAKREEAKNLRNRVKDTVKEMQETFFATPLCLTVAQMKECVAPVATLLELTEAFRERLAQKKQEKKIVDFSDMEHLALQILLKKEGEKWVPGPVALSYREYFHEILIDEYQDSNLVQEYLLQAISGEEEGRFNRFMVGDVKQSIYKFRLARPELFLEKYYDYSFEESNCQRIDLSKNFRSRDSVVDTVNGVFSQIMSREIGGIAYDEHAALYLGADYPQKDDTKSELILVERPEKEDELNVKQAEAAAIAKRIKELKESYLVTDKKTGELRPVEYRDMVILLRSNAGWDEEFRGILEEEGIPVYITSKTGYFSATEVQEVLQMFRILDNPRQDIPLFGVLKSIFGGFTEEEIAWIRSVDKKVSLWENICNPKKDGEESPLSKELLEKCSLFVKMVERYRGYTTYMPIRELLQTLVTEFHYLHYVSALPGGSKRKANVEMLFTKASEFEKTSYFGLFHFVRYIEQLEKYDVDYGEAELLDENADVVRIMSIHKSKGLEFPVVFVSGLSKRFNMQDVNKAVLMDMDMGIGVEYVNPTLRIRNKTLRRTVLSKKLREENLAEELRVLYVALTRAKEKLIMTGAVKDAGGAYEKWLENPTRGFSYMDFMNSTSFMDFLLPVLDESYVTFRVHDSLEDEKQTIEEQIKLYEKKEQLKNAFRYAKEDKLNLLRESFGYVYEHENLSGLYTKTTVSELKMAAMEEKDEAAYRLFEEKEPKVYLPSFMKEEESVSGTTRGNAFHKVMELMNWEKVYEGIFAAFPTGEEFQASMKEEILIRNLRGQLEAQVQSGKLKKEYRDIISERKLLHFLKDELAYRMWKADREGKLYREQPFVYGLSANRLDEAFPETETVLIQGIIDGFFIEEDGIVLVDYKTDKVETASELWERYATQVEYYEEAIGRLMNLPVTDKILYSFYLEACVRG